MITEKDWLAKNRNKILKNLTSENYKNEQSQEISVSNLYSLVLRVVGVLQMNGHF